MNRIEQKHFFNRLLKSILFTRIFLLFVICNSNIVCYSQNKAAPVCTNKGWGYLKKDMTWLIEPTFDRFWHDRMVVIADDESLRILCEFHNGMARIRKGGFWGYYNSSGVEIIKAQFKAEYDFNEEVAAVNRRGDWGYIDKLGNILIEPVYDEAQSFYDGIAAVKYHKKWGFISKQGQWIIAPQYENAKRFVGSLAAVKDKNKWGYIDKKNNWVINPEFDAANNFKDGIARVKINGGWRFIDSTGKFIVKPEFERLYPFSNNIARVRISSGWTFIDRKGKIFSAVFLNAEDFSDSVARVRTDSVWGFINTDGSWLIKPKYEAVGDFVNGIARVRTDAAPNSYTPGKWKFIDKKGNYLFENLSFDKAEDFNEGLARIRINDHWGFINERGEIIIKPEFEVCLDFLDTD